MHELRIGDRVLALARGDITHLAADAIVNAANEHLAGGGGVDGAIHRAGGPAIMADLEARYGQGRWCPTGSAVWTTAGRLPARWVIHAVGPVWSGGRRGERELLASAYRASMALAAELGARSVTLPAISCGIYGYPLAEGARVALETVAEALRGETAAEPLGGGTSDDRASPQVRPPMAGRASSVERATFVLYSADTYEAFEAALDELAFR